ncbi:MAG: hypothetical protein MJA27_06600 [Pseudanabaenales cyanobacterium]|nr:hypothetical protein [Pseudanabaenales cyanobacterium]
MQKKIENSKMKEVQAIIQPLIGQRAWDARIGVGSFLLIEFGKVVSKTAKATPRRPEYTYDRGEWGLWLYGCQWRIEHKETILSSSVSETRGEMELAVSKFNSQTVETIDIAEPFWDAVFTFSNGHILKTFSTYMIDEHWTLRTPNGKYLAAGPGTNWEYRPGNIPPSGQNKP